MTKNNHKINKKRLKLLFLTPSVIPGGAERVMSILCNEMANDNDVTLLSLEGDKDFYPISDKVNRINLQESMKGMGKLKRLFSILPTEKRRLEKIERVVIDNNPDVIISFLFTTNVFAIQLGKKYNIPVLVSERNDPSQYSTVRKALMNHYYPHADGMVCQSKLMQEYAKKQYGIKNVTTIPNPISKGQYAAKATKKTNKIISVGRLIPQKNHLMLIKAFLRVHERFNDYKLYIYGDGPLRKRYQDFIDQNGANDYIELKLPERDVIKKERDSKLFVLPSNFEGYPNVLIEAMANSLISISTDFSTGSAGDIIRDGHNGFLIETNNKKQLEEKIIDILSNYDDYKRIEDEAAKIADANSSETVVASWRSLIGKISDSGCSIKKKWPSKRTINSIRYLILLLYFISFSAYRLGVGFDMIFVRAMFVIAIAVSVSIYIKKIARPKVFLWCLLFWGYFMLSSFWAVDTSDTFSYLPLMAQMLGICFVVPTYIKDRESCDKVFKILLISLLYSAILLAIRTPLSNYGTERVGGALGLNSNAFGLRMAVGAVVSLYLFHNEEQTSNKKKTLYIPALIILTVMGLLSGSKKTLLAIIIGLPAFEIIRSKGIKRVKRAVLAIIIVTIGIFAIFADSTLYRVLGSRVEKTYNTVIKGETDEELIDKSLIERKFYKNSAIRLFIERPIVGQGGNNFRTHMRQINFHRVSYSHDNYMELLSTLGVIGFTLYYGFWIYIICKLIKMKGAEANSAKYLLLTLIAIFLALDFANVSYISEIYMVVISIAAAYVEALQSKISTIEQSKNEKARKTT